MTARFRIAPIFELRPAGVSFAVLERLGTPSLREHVAQLTASRTELERTAEATVERLSEVANRGLRPKLKSKLKRHAQISAEHLAAYPALHEYGVAYDRLGAATSAFEDFLEREYRALHPEIMRAAEEVLPDFFVIESDGDSLFRLLQPSSSTNHNKWDRQDDRTIALYLQRVCAKNDSISRFGPTAWGTVVPGDGIHFGLEPVIAERRVAIERWVVMGLIEVMNRDLELRLEAFPRLHPHGRLEPDRFCRLDDDRVISLAADEHEVAARCDGQTPAYAIGADATLERLRAHEVIVWAIEPHPRDNAPLASLQRDVAGWRAGPNRDRWTTDLDRVAELGRRFAAHTSAPERRAVLSELHSLLEELGVVKRQSNRMLYGARNPLNENCLQAGTITIGARSLERMVAEASPWFELFRDSMGLAAVHTYRRLLELVRVAPRARGSLSYSSLVHAARREGFKDLDDGSFAEQQAAEAWTIISREFTALISHRPDAAVWRLTAEECGFLRRQYQLPASGELSLPSADLQVIAASREDAEAGRLDWVISELHYGLAPLQHSAYWCCPDKPALHAVMQEVYEDRAFCWLDAGANSPVHVSGEAVTVALRHSTYLGTGRPKPAWRSLRPADAEVVVDEERFDVRLRAGGEDLGSIVRSPNLFMAMHPFFPFARAPHAPRLLVGDVVVQRQTWHVDSAAIAELRPAGISTTFVAGLERLRAERGIPRWVFVRPPPGAMTGQSSNRDKDNKPICVDLESVVFLDLLERRLRKYGTLVLSEMMPAPDQLPLQLASGPFTFEIRTNLVGA